MQNWDFKDGLIEAKTAGFSDADMIALVVRLTELKRKELQRRLSAVPPLVACRVVGSGQTDLFIPFQSPDVRPKFGYLLCPLNADNNSGLLHTLLLAPSTGMYAIVEEPSHDELRKQLALRSELERRAWAESIFLKPDSKKTVAERVITEAIQRQLRYREIRRRTKSLPSDIWQRIVWDSALECFIPQLAICAAPDHGYFVLPVRSLANEGDFESLLLPPNASRATVIAWPYSSELVASLKMRPNAEAINWLEVMVEEFGLTAEETSAWAVPKLRGSKTSWDQQALFRRELMASRAKEIALRMKGIITALEENDMGDRINPRHYVAIPKGDIDLDPEQTTYVFEIQLNGAEFCLVSLPGNRQPIVTACSYQWLSRQVFKDGNAEVREWLRKLIRSKDEQP